MNLLAATLLLAQAGAAGATIDCSAPVTQSAMTICATREWQQADADLNAQWEQTAASMRQRDMIHDHSHDDRPGFLAQLLAAQRAWLAFRDAHCASEGYLARGGTLEPMLVAGCKTELTKVRTRQLQAIEEWPE